MSRTILFIAAFWLAVPLWGQSGIMPRRSSSIKIPSQETMEKIIEADPELVSREPVSTLSDTTSRALLFSPVAVDMLGFDKPYERYEREFPFAKQYTLSVVSGSLENDLSYPGRPNDRLSYSHGGL